MKYTNVWTAILVIALIVSGCTPSTPTEAPPPPTQAVQDTSWQKVQQAGVLRVGTTADYPPFEYYNEKVELDGFDIALIKQIGQRLGLGVEISPYAFEDLPNVVAMGQVDVVISAISVTPERQAIANFTNIYYAGSDAVLSRPEANPQSLQNTAALASARLGVQVNSIYQTYAQKKLLDTGLMPRNNLLVYADINQAVNALKAKQIDAVWMDLRPAQAFASAGGVKILAQDLNQQLYSIGMMKGADALRDKLNEALTSLNNDGTLAGLQVQYLGLDPEDVVTPQPPPTPIPQPTLVPAGCSNASKYVKDLSYDDKDHKNPPTLYPGQAFTKGWRIQNIGSCTWKKGYVLAYSYGNVPAAQMGGQPIPVTRDVKPNDTYDFQVNLVAPVVAGRYTGYWDMRDAQNYKFGKTIWVDIIVPDPPTITPPPFVPVPNIKFSASPLIINEGSPVYFEWTTENAQYVYFYHDGEKWSEEQVSQAGNSTDYPPSSMFYYLRVISFDGKTSEQPIWITVNSLPDAAPDVEYVSADPQGIVISQCTTLYWSVKGEADNVVLLVDGVKRSEQEALIGNTRDCPTTAGQHVYMIQAFGPGGQDTGQVTVDVMGEPVTQAPVIDVPTDTPVPPIVEIPTDTPAPPPITEVPTQPPVVIELPEIQGFTATPTVIGQGQSVMLAWTTGGGTTRIELSRDSAVIYAGTELNYSVTDIPPTEGVTVIQYTLVAFNNAGDPVSSVVTVEVQ